MRGGNPNGKPVGFRQHNQRTVISASWRPVPAPQNLKAVPGSESVLRYGCAVLWWRGGSGPAMHRLSGVRVRKRWCRPGNWQTTKAAAEKFLHLSAWLVLLLVWNCFLSFIDEKSGINYRILPKTATKLRKKIQHKGQAELGIYTKKAHRFDVLSCGGPTRTGDLQVMSLASYQLLHPAMFSWFRVQRYRQFSIHASFCTKKIFLNAKNCF